MELAVYDQADLFERLQGEWNDLLRRSYSDTVFATWEWNKTWWEAYQPGRLWVVTCRDEDGHLLGIAPWSIVERNGERIVSAIGCIDVTDYVDVIIDQECTETVLNCFASFLQARASAYDRIDLCNFPQNSPTLSHFPELLQQRGFMTETEQLDVCPVIALPGDWESYLNLLDKKQRHELRRKIRRAGNDVDWYMVGAEHDLREETERFKTLMAASDPLKARFLENPHNTAFFDAIVPVLFERGWLQMSFLTHESKAVAAYFNIDYHKRLMVYNSGLLRESYDGLSAGIVLIAHNIRHAIEQGYEAFDFLRGDETYKYYLGGKDTGVFAVRARRSQ